MRQLQQHRSSSSARFRRQPHLRCGRRTINRGRVQSTSIYCIVSVLIVFSSDVVLSCRCLVAYISELLCYCCVNERQAHILTTLAWIMCRNSVHALRPAVPGSITTVQLTLPVTTGNKPVSYFSMATAARLIVYRYECPHISLLLFIYLCHDDRLNGLLTTECLLSSLYYATS